MWFSELTFILFEILHLYTVESGIVRDNNAVGHDDNNVGSRHFINQIQSGQGINNLQSAMVAEERMYSSGRGSGMPAAGTLSRFGYSQPSPLRASPYHHPNSYDTHPPSYKDAFKPKDSPTSKSGSAVRSPSASKTLTHATPEIHVIYDDSAIATIKKYEMTVNDFYSRIFKYIKKKFEAIDGLKVTPKFIGLTHLKKSLIPNPPLKLVGDTLSYFREGRKNKTIVLPEADIVLYTTGTPLSQEDTVENAITTETGGVTYLGTVCSPTQNLILLKMNGQGEEAQDIVHELGHSLGTDHDPEDGDKKCHWDEGYIMSYDYNTAENKMQFSSCSIRAMKTNLQQESKKCVFKNSGKSEVNIRGTKDDQSMSRDVICRGMVHRFAKYKTLDIMESFSAYLGKDLLCKKTACSFQVGNETKSMLLNFPSPDGWVCGDNMKCKMWRCVEQ